MPRKTASIAVESPSLQQVLNQHTVDSLKRLVELLGVKPLPTRKHELITLIEQHLIVEKLRLQWDQLDPIQRLAVSETAYSSDGVFDSARFRAKHGELPVFETPKNGSKYDKLPTRLRLFIYGGVRWGSTWTSLIPYDLKRRLLSFVPQPEAPTLKSNEILPESSALIQCNMEQAAQVDLPLLLRLVDSGKVTVSNKTFQPSSATMKMLSERLDKGDFYELKPKVNKWEQEIGFIKAFAWPLLVQAGKLAELQGSKLILTKAGRKALSQPSSESLRLIWQRWLKTKLLDEFSRINNIKGQQGKGKPMTAVVPRREKVSEALAQCPVGQWVQIDELWRFMQAADFNFEVTHDPWNLYIADRQYGSLGYDGYHQWSVLQGRYVLCLLFEYIATLGIIDVAYTDPVGARRDFSHMWGTDEMDFLSRYDGLQFIRLNPLGAYCLGLTDQYTPKQIQTQSSISVLPSLQINITRNPLSANETLLLESYANCESDTVWRLDLQKALLSVENGHSISELLEFLEARDDQPLPESAEHFIMTAERQGKALRHQGTAVLIECMDSQLADLIAGNTETASLCQRVGDRHLVVKSEMEEKFRKAVHELGYGMPKI